MIDVMDRLRAANPVPRDLSTGWSHGAEGAEAWERAHGEVRAPRQRRSWAAAVVAAAVVLVLAISVTLVRDRSDTASVPSSRSIARLARGDWEAIPSLPSDMSGEMSTIWTGREVIVWANDRGAELVDGAWRRLPDASGWYGTTVRWTGTDMIVLGGNGAVNTRYVGAAAYDPRTRTWRRLADPPLSVQGGVSTATWTGRVLVVTGRVPGQPQEAASYDPGKSQWEPLPRLQAELVGKVMTRAAWDGARVVLTYSNGLSVATYALDPTRGTWEGLSIPPRSNDQMFSDVFRWRDDIIQVAWLGSSLQSSRLHSSTWVIRHMYPHPSLCEVSAIAVPGGAVVQCSRAPGLAYSVGANRWFELPPTAGRHFKISSLVWTGESLVAVSLDGQVRRLS